MAPLKEDGRSDKEELIGKALLLESFISDSTENDDLQTPESSERRSQSYRDARGSIVITLKNVSQFDRLESYDEVSERKPSVRHQLKAKMALFAVLFLIGFMAIFAFMTIKKHSQMNASESGFLSVSNLGFSMENKTETIGLAKLNETKTEDHTLPLR